MEDCRRSTKYKVLPNAVKHFVMAKDIAKAVKTVSKEKQCHKIMTIKKLPMVANYRKVEHEHWRFNMMEARAITCFNTGNLVFKDSNPHQMRTRNKGDRWCLGSACEGRDSYMYVRY